MDAIAAPQSEPAPLPDSPIVVQVDHLRKVYRTGFWMNRRVEPLKGISLAVHQGETFGLLGPNGAGKTTLLKLLLGLVRPSAGRGQVLGARLGDSASHHRIGYLPENAYFYDYLTGWEFLQFSAGLFGLGGRRQKERITQLLDQVGLAQSAAKKKQLRQYSKGMLQRIGMAQALINNPDLLFLDEPMSGLDPLGRVQIREIIQTLKAEGKTIFFNSHVLSDVEQICDRVAILAQGELLCTGSIDQLLGSSNRYHVTGRGGNLELLGRWIPDLDFQTDDWQGHLDRQPQDFLASLQLMGGQLIAMKLARPTLEEFFVQQLQDRGLQQSA